MDKDKLARLLIEYGALIRCKPYPSINELRRAGASHGAARRIQYILSQIPATTEVTLEEAARNLKFDDPLLTDALSKNWSHRDV